MSKWKQWRLGHSELRLWCVAFSGGDTMQDISKAGVAKLPCDKRPVVVGKWRNWEAGLRTYYPPWTVSNFHREAKLLRWHDRPPLTDDEGETQRLSDRPRTGKSQDWASTQRSLSSQCPWPFPRLPAAHWHSCDQASPCPDHILLSSGLLLWLC